MPYRTESTVIDGRTWEMRTHPGSEAIDLKMGLGKYLPANILQILICAQSAPEAMDALDAPEIKAAMLAAIYGYSAPAGSNGDGRPLSYWVRESMRYTTVDPLPFGVDIKGSAYEHFDEVFSGDLDGVVEVMKWLLSVNFTKPSSSNQSPDGEGTPSSEAPTEGSSRRPSIRVSSSPAKTPPETST